MNKIYKIAAIPGDGIGREVMPEGIGGSFRSRAYYT